MSPASPCADSKNASGPEYKTWKGSRFLNAVCAHSDTLRSGLFRFVLPQSTVSPPFVEDRDLSLLFMSRPTESACGLVKAKGTITMLTTTNINNCLRFIRVALDKYLGRLYLKKGPAMCKCKWCLPFCAVFCLANN